MVAQQHQLRVLVVAHETLARLRGLHEESLGVGIALVISVVDHSRPHLLGIELLDAHDVVLVVVVHVEVRAVVVAVLQDDQYQVVVEELTEVLAVLVVVQSVDVGVPPHLQSAQRRVAQALQRDARHGILRQRVAACGSSLDGDVGERTFDEQFLVSTLGLQDGVERHLDGLGLAVRVGGEVEHFRSGLALRQVHFSVAGDGGHVETLDVVRSCLSVAIHHVVGCARVVLLEHLHVQDVLAYEQFLGHAHHLHLAVAIEDDDVVDVRAVAHELVLLQSRAYEAFLAVDVEFLRSLDHLCSLDAVEVANLRAPRVLLAIFLLDALKPVDGDFHHVGQVVVDVLDFLFDAGDEVVGLFLVELQNALHLDFHEPQDVVARHLAYQVFLEGLQSLVQMLHHGVHVRRLFKLAVLVHAFFDENAFQRGEEQLFLQFALPDFQFHAQQGFRAVGVVAQHVAHGQEARFVVPDHAAVGRDVDFAVGEGIERVNGLVARHARRQVHLYLHVGSCQVLHLLGLDLAFLNGLHDGVLQCL